MRELVNAFKAFEELDKKIHELGGDTNDNLKELVHEVYKGKSYRDWEHFISHLDKQFRLITFLSSRFDNVKPTEKEFYSEYVISTVSERQSPSNAEIKYLSEKDIKTYYEENLNVILTKSRLNEWIRVYEPKIRVLQGSIKPILYNLEDVENMLYNTRKIDQYFFLR